MASYSKTKAVLQQRKPFPNDGIGRPRMLKDFLNDTSNSCSSTGFKSLPRQPCNPNAQVFTNNTNTKFLRSQSKAASTAISALQAMINAVKNFPLKKASSILPRSLSRGLSRKKPSEVKITIRVKDIIRWTSFRDMVEEKSQPLDFNSSPNHCTTTTITTGSTTTTCSSNSSSWCESDFTSDYLPSWAGNSQDNVVNEVEVRKKYLPRVGEDCLKTTTGTETYADVGPKGELWCDEREQQSPVSVLDFQVGEGGEPFSSFTQSLANMERTRQNLMQKIQLFESLAKLEPFNQEEWMSVEENTKFVEEEPDEFETKVSELFVKTTSTVDIGNAGVELLLLDFFRDELTTKRCRTKMDDDDEFDSEVVSMAKAWVRGEHNGLHEWGIEHKREAYISDMYRRERWSNFEEEQEELAFEFETGILGDLLDEVLVDLFLH